MHQTRRHILDILERLGSATVDQIVGGLRQPDGRSISAVTVRYHLGILQEEGLVSQPKTIERETRGRPQHLFSLTQPRQVRDNSAEVLRVLLSVQTSEEAMKETARAMTTEVQTALEGLEREARMTFAVGFLNQRGYEAQWEPAQRGVILTTRHCPYQSVASVTGHLCMMDMHLMEFLVGAPPQRLTRISDGDAACSYWFELE
jgi:predicted ArsR family transcriptional regulator